MSTIIKMTKPPARETRRVQFTMTINRANDEVNLACIALLSWHPGTPNTLSDPDGWEATIESAINADTKRPFEIKDMSDEEYRAAERIALEQ